LLLLLLPLDILLLLLLPLLTGRSTLPLCRGWRLRDVLLLPPDVLLLPLQVLLLLPLEILLLLPLQVLLLLALEILLLLLLPHLSRRSILPLSYRRLGLRYFRLLRRPRHFSLLLLPLDVLLLLLPYLTRRSILPLSYRGLKPGYLRLLRRSQHFLLLLLLSPSDVVLLLLPLNILLPLGVLLLLLLAELPRRSILPLGYRGRRNRIQRRCALRPAAHRWLNTPYLAHVHYANRGGRGGRTLPYLLDLGWRKRTTRGLS